MTAFHLRAAARALRAGKVVAYPTEAVWGLGCDPRNAPAVAHLLALKQRNPGKGLILIADRFESVVPFLAELTAEMGARIYPTWPGPVTWILPAADWVPKALTGGRKTLAVRVTAHPPAAALCHAFGGAIVSTSANLSGRPAARTQRAALAYFRDGVVYLPGATGGQQRPSQIRDGRTGRELRPA